MADWSQHSQRLTERKRELSRDVLKIEDRLDDERSKNFEDRATERQGDDVLQALGTHDVGEIRQIEAALDRIANGTYGACVICGDPIAEKRLEALPATPFCATCAG